MCKTTCSCIPYNGIRKMKNGILKHTSVIQYYRNTAQYYCLLPLSMTYYNTKNQYIYIPLRKTKVTRKHQSHALMIVVVECVIYRLHEKQIHVPFDYMRSKYMYPLGSGPFSLFMIFLSRWMDVPGFH